MDLFSIPERVDDTEISYLLLKIEAFKEQKIVYLSSQLQEMISSFEVPNSNPTNLRSIAVGYLKKAAIKRWSDILATSLRKLDDHLENIDEYILHDAVRFNHKLLFEINQFITETHIARKRLNKANSILQEKENRVTNRP